MAVFSALVQMLNLLLAFKASTVSGPVPGSEDVAASVTGDWLSPGHTFLVGSVPLLAQTCSHQVFFQVFASFRAVDLAGPSLAKAPATGGAYRFSRWSRFGQVEFTVTFVSAVTHSRSGKFFTADNTHSRLFC